MMASKSGKTVKGEIDVWWQDENTIQIVVRRNPGPLDRPRSDIISGPILWAEFPQVYRPDDVAFRSQADISKPTDDVRFVPLASLMRRLVAPGSSPSALALA